jgi:hypothetical protein
MKLESKFIEVQGGIGEQSYNATISQEDMHKMWDMLQNPYKNSIGSIVREITSNCFDSHAEAGVTDAVRLKYGKDEAGFYVSFIDVGVGLSPTSIENIFLKYLKSTKENSNQFIGAFGLGSKSPLSYQDFFYINTRHEGIEYNYMMYKGEQSPKIDLLKKSDTTERNGTEIKIQIKTENDLLRFLSETYSQLHYFRNVVVDLDDISAIYYYGGSSSIRSILNTLKSDYNLIEGKNFILRTNTSYNELHLCIGSVMYPIDWANLKTPRVSIPVALKFDIGELPVIQTREDIRYTDKAILAIKEKIELLRDELTEIRRNQLTKDFDTFDEFLKTAESAFNNNSLVLGEDPNTISISVRGFINTTNLPAPQIKGFPKKFKDLQDIIDFKSYLNSYICNTNLYGDIDFKDDFLRQNFHIQKKFNAGGALQSTNIIDGEYSYSSKVGFKLNRNTNTFNGLLSFLTRIETTRAILIKVSRDQVYSSKKNRYIQEVLFNSSRTENIHFFSINKHFNISVSTIKNLLIFFKSKEVVSYLLKYLYNKFEKLIKYEYNSIDVDEQWWKDRQAANKTVVDYDRTLMAIERYHGADWNRKDIRLDIKQFLNYEKQIKIIITKDDQKRLCSNNVTGYITPLEKMIFELKLLKKANYISTDVVLYSMSDRNFKKVLEARGENSCVYTLEEFLKDKKMQTRILSKLITVVKIRQHYKELVTQTSNLSVLNNSIKLFNQSLQEEHLYLMTTLSNMSISLTPTQLETLLKDIDDVALELDLYDKDLINRFNDFAEFLVTSKISFLPNDPKSYLLFVSHYVPSKSKYRLLNRFHKKDITQQDLIDQYNEIYNENVTDFKDVEKTLNDDGFYYNSVNTGKMVLNLLYKLHLTGTYSPLTFDELKLDLTKETKVEEAEETTETEEVEIDLEENLEIEII